MKKLLALVLAAALTIGMVVTASATSSPVAETVSVPEVVVSEENAGIVIELVATEDAEALTEEKQEVYVAAQEALEEAAPAEMTAVSFFYFQALAENEKGEKTEIAEPIEVTLKIDEVTEIKDITEVKVMQFVNGEWVELEVVMNPDGTITIKGVVDGPIAIFAK